MCANFGEKGAALTFSTQICPKLDFGIKISKIQVRIWNLHFQDATCANLPLKQTTLTFLIQICPKRILGFEIQKNNVAIRICILVIPCAPIFRRNKHFWFLGPNLPKNRFLGQNFKNLNLDPESGSLRYYKHQFFRQNLQFWLFGHKFAFGVRISKI